MSNYVIPSLLLILFLYCLLKKIPIFDAFIEGGKEAVPLVLSIFPYLVGIFFMVELCEVSGFIEILEKLLSPLFSFLGVPVGVTKLVIFRPFSGSGSLAILQDIFDCYGVDSFEGRVGSAICGAGETVFYLVAVYFASSGIKKLGKAVGIAIFCSLFGVVLCSILCKIM